MKSSSASNTFLIKTWIKTNPITVFSEAEWANVLMVNWLCVAVWVGCGIIVCVTMLLVWLVNAGLLQWRCTVAAVSNLCWTELLACKLCPRESSYKIISMVPTIAVVPDCTMKRTTCLIHPCSVGVACQTHISTWPSQLPWMQGICFCLLHDNSEMHYNIIT